MTDESLRQSDVLLTDLTEMVETARAVPMSASCVVPRERMLDLLDELREVLPGEIDEARTVLARRERLLQDAYENAAADTRARGRRGRHRPRRRRPSGRADARGRPHRGARRRSRTPGSNTPSSSRRPTCTRRPRRPPPRCARTPSATSATSPNRRTSYDSEIRAEADRYNHDARADAERYATKLTADAEDYAERTLDELSAVLHRSAQTAEQGRAALAQRRADAWAEQQPEAEERPPISA